jgi:6-phosphogluconolactonase
VVIRFRDPEGVARAAASAVVEAAFKATHDHGDFHLVLAGGSTPRRAYELLASDFRDEVDWRRVTFYFGDERCVPPDHPESNYRMAREALLGPLRVGSSRVRRVAGELPPAAAAADYDAELQGLEAVRAPMFDLVLLGMGEEGHTASLFPGSAALSESGHRAVAVTVPKPPSERVTLTPRALASATQVLFLVTGEGKAEALASVFTNPETVPAAIVANLAPSRFLVDDAAARDLPG